MFDRLLNLLTGREPPASPGGDSDLQHAVAALLVEAARMDDTFNEAEQATIESVLTERFNLQPAAVKSLMADAGRTARNATQYYSFTRQINDNLSGEERVQIIEMLWKVAYSDGALDPHEDMLLRRIAGLIYVTDMDRGLARKRALAALGIKDELDA